MVLMLLHLITADNFFSIYFTVQYLVILNFKTQVGPLRFFMYGIFFTDSRFKIVHVFFPYLRKRLDSNYSNRIYLF